MCVGVNAIEVMQEVYNTRRTADEKNGSGQLQRTAKKWAVSIQNTNVRDTKCTKCGEKFEAGAIRMCAWAKVRDGKHPMGREFYHPECTKVDKNDNFIAVGKATETDEVNARQKAENNNNASKQQ